MFALEKNFNYARMIAQFDVIFVREGIRHIWFHIENVQLTAYNLIKPSSEQCSTLIMS